MVAVSAAVIIYLRYRLVKELNRGADVLISRMNLVGLGLGFLSALGMSMVANFQVSLPSFSFPHLCLPSA